MPQEKKKDRASQPRCASVYPGGVCNHSLSFHGKDHGRCRALGCGCPQYTPADQTSDATT